MAGSNKALKTDQSLFNEGDPADSMYIVRRGEIKVYLHKDGHEVSLATIGEGGIVGEMAFFDQKPRSASVKATKDAEVTVITKDDFGKLMKQIPKWFVTLMSSLSVRLRQTNERLQKIESQQAGVTAPFENSIKILHVINLLWFKDGVKTGKDWFLNQDLAVKTLSNILRMPPDSVKKILGIFADQKIFVAAQDQYRNPVYALTNRGNLERLIVFLTQFTNDNPSRRQIPSGVSEYLDALLRLATKSAYEQITVAIDDIIADGAKNGKVTKTWDSYTELFKKPSEAMSLVKMSETKMGFKIDKQELPKLVDHFKIIVALAAAGAP